MEKLPKNRKIAFDTQTSFDGMTGGRQPVLSVFCHIRAGSIRFKIPTLLSIQLNKEFIREQIGHARGQGQKRS